MSDQLDPRIASVFAEYRRMFPDPEVSPSFMPGLWQRIDARQSYAIGFKRFAQTIITAAAAVSIMMGALMVYQQQPAVHTTSYLEVLAASESRDMPDSIGDAEIVVPNERAR